MQITSTQLKIKTKRDDSYELSLFFCFMEGEYENPTHILTLHIIEKLMSALCNLDYCLITPLLLIGIHVLKATNITSFK